MKIGDFSGPTDPKKGYIAPYWEALWRPKIAYNRDLRLDKIANFHPNSLKILSDVKKPLVFHFPVFYIDTGTLDPYIWTQHIHSPF